MIDDILKELDKEIQKHSREFKKNVERNEKKIAKDPNEFFLNIPGGNWKFPKNVEE